MPDLPSSEITVDENALAAAGSSYLTVISAVKTNADATPRVFSSLAALLAQHDFCDAVDFAGMFFDEVDQPILFVGLPIVTAGTVGRHNTSGNTDTCVTTVAAGGDGVLGEHDGVLKVVTGGTIGTDQIMLDLSLDGGRTFKRVRLGTANSYVIPYIGVTVSFAAGDLTAGETVHTWHGSAPRWDQAGLAAARTALTAQQKQSRSWLVVGDLLADTDATDILTEVNGYDTSGDRFTVARAQLRDRLPYATMSRVRVRMSGSPTLTFAEIGATGDTITRSAGSWITDGFAIGDIITVSGSVSNNITTAAKITNVTALVITLDTDDLVNEGPVGGCTVTGTPSLVFAEVGATGDTITRNRGSWLDDGFRAGDKVVITGSASNNITATVGIATVTATVITFDTTDLVAEVIGSYGVSITAGETKAQHVAALDAEFAAVDAEKRIDLGHGRARKMSPILGYRMRRPAQWSATIREYQHDVHIPCWRKGDGPLSGWDLFDADGNLYEHDERVDGGALAARFTCLRTYANGPAGAFVALSLTRASEGSLLSRTHNLHVANIACTTAQASCEDAIGLVLALKSDGKATEDSLKKLEEKVNTDLSIALLQDKGEGARASSAVWTASRNDILNVPGATLTWTLNLLLNGTLEKLSGSVRIQTAG